MTTQGVETDYGPTVEEAGPEWLFVGGCQRSGTTAMVDLLNLDPRIVLGVERFKFAQAAYSIERFAPQIFFNPVPQETNGLDLNMYDTLRRRWVSGGVRYFGDKNPLYVRQLVELEQTYQGCRMIMMMRDPIDVANSFYLKATNPRDHWPERNDHRVAVVVWNKALQSLRDYVQADRRPVFIADYESLFAGDQRHVESLYRFLEMSVPDVIRERAEVMRQEWPKRAARSRALPPEAVAEVDAECNRELEKWARERIASQLEP